jgi:ferritin-like metal-binding protein YciE
MKPHEHSSYTKFSEALGDAIEGANEEVQNMLDKEQRRAFDADIQEAFEAKRQETGRDVLTLLEEETIRRDYFAQLHDTLLHDESTDEALIQTVKDLHEHFERSVKLKT